MRPPTEQQSGQEPSSVKLDAWLFLYRSKRAIQVVSVGPPLSPPLCILPERHWPQCLSVQCDREPVKTRLLF